MEQPSEETVSAERDPHYLDAIDRSAYVNAGWPAARNLSLFFENKNWGGDAVVASDFLDDWPVKSSRSQPRDAPTWSSSRLNSGACDCS
jgi:hypothetical protein